MQWTPRGAHLLLQTRTKVLNDDLEDVFRPDVWDIYAQRDQTGREHLQEILERLGLKQFDRTHHREIAKWLLPTALQTTQGLVLAEAAINELRRRRIVLPPGHRAGLRGSRHPGPVSHS
jgi:hypothetical protein